MEKIDYKKELKHLYRSSAGKVEIVEVPQMNFLMINGKGDPNTSQEFKHAVEALFSLSYAIKFMIKKGEAGIDYGVLPLEGLWWADDMSSFSVDSKENWKWTLMIMQPEFVTKEMVEKATEEVRKKKSLIALPLVRFESFAEGKAAQIMHIGPFSEEGPTVEKMHVFIEDNGSQRIGKHHEIYLSDIRRSAPEKWKTIIRQPMS
ncbi:MAG: GyrI-like domain-containing protein [Candidatus Marinimicrobia bacterium]|nr:GyrI-like domain-containing protein [bacterium]MCG2716933.1 GyrI-like domain-containing protein [Candidatus Neomarinimicrobiota bacterium]